MFNHLGYLGIYILYPIHFSFDFLLQQSFLRTYSSPKLAPSNSHALEIFLILWLVFVSVCCQLHLYLPWPAPRMYAYVQHGYIPQFVFSHCVRAPGVDRAEYYHFSSTGHV
jgi:hypothetical protein